MPVSKDSSWVEKPPSLLNVDTVAYLNLVKIIHLTMNF